MQEQWNDLPQVEVIGKLPKAFAAEPKIGDLLP